eukprot:403358901
MNQIQGSQKLASIRLSSLDRILFALQKSHNSRLQQNVLQTPSNQNQSQNNAQQNKIDLHYNNGQYCNDYQQKQNIEQNDNYRDLKQQSGQNGSKIEVRPKIRQNHPDTMQVLTNHTTGVKSYQTQKQLILNGGNPTSPQPYLENLYVQTHSNGFNQSQKKKKHKQQQQQNNFNDFQLNNPYLRKQSVRAFSQQKHKISDLLTQAQRNNDKNINQGDRSTSPKYKKLTQDRVHSNNKDLQIVSEKQEEHSNDQILASANRVRRQQSQQETRRQVSGKNSGMFAISHNSIAQNLGESQLKQHSNFNSIFKIGQRQIGGQQQCLIQNQAQNQDKLSALKFLTLQQNEKQQYQTQNELQKAISSSKSGATRFKIQPSNIKQLGTFEITSNQNQLVKVPSNIDKLIPHFKEDQLIDFQNVQKQMNYNLNKIQQQAQSQFQQVQGGQGESRQKSKNNNQDKIGQIDNPMAFREEVELRELFNLLSQNNSRPSKSKSNGKIKFLGGLALLSVCGFVAVSHLNSRQELNIVNEQEFALQTFEKDQDSPIMKEYVNYLAKHQKTYSSNSFDIKAKYINFKNNFLKILSHNEDDSQSFEMGLNSFSDMSQEEFEKIINKGILIRPDHALKVKPLPEVSENSEQKGRFLSESLELQQSSTTSLPEYVNWYKEGKVTRPQDQRMCGSCWAFSAVSALESLAFMSGNSPTLQEFSVQQLVDCDEVNFACGGGWMYDAFGYVKNNGISLRNSYGYDYSSRRRDCVYRPSTQNYFRNTGMIEEDGNKNERMKELVSERPISIAMFASGMMQHYKGGVLTEDYLKCSSNLKEVNHGIVLVGYGKVKQGDRVRGVCKEYWIIRNSWGPNWGEEGFFRLCMDGAGSKKTPFGTCLVNKYATWPNMDGVIKPPTDGETEA